MTPVRWYTPSSDYPRGDWQLAVLKAAGYAPSRRAATIRFRAWDGWPDDVSFAYWTSIHGERALVFLTPLTTQSQGPIIAVEELRL